MIMHAYTYSYRGARLYAVVPALGVLLLGAVTAAAAVDDALSRQLALLLLGWALVFGVAAWRCARMGFDIRGGELHIHNIASHRRLQRDDVVAVSFTKASEGAGRRILQVHLYSGRRVRIWSVGYLWEGGMADRARRQHLVVQSWIDGTRPPE